jgi:hypothetical protein
VLRRAVTTLAFAALAVAGAMLPREAHAKSPYLEIPPEEEVLVAPAYRYANMTDAEAFAELDRRKIPYTREKATPGVRAPIRLAGKLHDVWIHSSLREEERAGSVFEILDARLALALDDFSVILARHDVVEVTHYTMYRPNMPMPGTEPRASKDAAKDEVEKPSKKSARGKGKRRASLDGKATKGPKGSRKPGSGETRRKDFELHDHEHDYLEIELATGGDDQAAKGKPKSAPKTDGGKAAGKKRAAPSKGRSAKKRILATTDEQPHGKWAPPGTRHPAGLAIDVGILKKSDGSMLHVAAHFRGKIGARTCGDGAPEGETAPAKELREIVCEAREAGVFTYALTPNFDAAHADHFHLEIKPGVKWFLFH